MSANAADADQSAEQVGLLGSLSSVIEPLGSVAEPVTGLANVIVDEAALLDQLVPADDLLGSAGFLADGSLTDLVTQPLNVVARTVTPDLAGARAETVTDRSMDRSPMAHPPAERAADARGPASSDLGSLLGSVDRLLITVDGIIPGAASDPVIDAAPVRTEEVNDAAEAVTPSHAPTFGMFGAAGPLAVLTGIVSMLDLPLVGGLDALDPIAPLLAPLESVIRTAVPVLATIDPVFGFGGFATLIDPAWQAFSHETSATPLQHRTTTKSAETATTHAPDHGAAVPVDHFDSEPVVNTSSLDPSPGHSPADSGGGLRPSVLVAPLAGITALHAVPGVAPSADQAGPSSHAWLPEEAVLRARLFSAAAYARSVEVRPLREANDPPVSPD